MHSNTKREWNFLDYFFLFFWFSLPFFPSHFLLLQSKLLSYWSSTSRRQGYIRCETIEREKKPTLTITTTKALNKIYIVIFPISQIFGIQILASMFSFWFCSFFQNQSIEKLKSRSIPESNTKRRAMRIIYQKLFVFFFSFC